MSSIRWTTTSLTVLALFSISCTSGEQGADAAGNGMDAAGQDAMAAPEANADAEPMTPAESPESEEHEAGQQEGEHQGGQHDEGDEEESGVQLAKSDTYDENRGGCRLILRYDSETNAFTGTAENITSSEISGVRVEVHLSNGIELGPTTPVDLAPGQTVDINLPASEQSFDTWSAHAEVG